MILFNLPKFDKLARNLESMDPRVKPEDDINRGYGDNINRGYFEKHVFSNDTSQLRLKTNVKNKNCFILGATSPPQDLFDLIFLSDTLKKEGAKKVTAIIPYLAYSRQDANEQNKSWGLMSIAKIFKASEIDKIITFDLHSELGRKLFRDKLVSVDVAELFAKQIQKMRLRDFCVIAPDEGAINRAQKLKKALRSRKFGYFKKIRTNGIRHYKYHGDKAMRAIIYDDILDTGGTLISAVKKLKRLNFKEIYIFVTHGQFTGVQWKDLFKLNVKKIYTTDTIPIKLKGKRIDRLSIAPLLAPCYD